MWGKRFGIEIKHICHVANRSVFTKPSFSAIKGPKSSKQGFRGEVKKITTIQEIYYISICSSVFRVHIMYYVATLNIIIVIY